jgi:hypothetical protein
VTVQNITPIHLIVKLVIYFVILLSLNIASLLIDSDSLQYMPIGGTDALEQVTDTDDIEITQSMLSDLATGSEEKPSGVSIEEIRVMLVFLTTTLMGTVLVMIPVTWTYIATTYDAGTSKTFVRALMVLPICGSTVVLLIQDSLALAFGLAALVAAVRFRVALAEAIDGIYIFAAICIGLAAGIGHLGVAAVMAMFFCLVNAVLGQMDYGRNPVDDARRAAKKAKLNKNIA